MKPLSIQDVRKAVAGKPLAPLPADMPLVRAVCTDSRHMQPGSLFIALRGDRFDGHKFLPQAAAGGAIAALVGSPPEIEQPNLMLLQVPDTRKAMGQLAAFVRQQMQAKVVAVAGSNGKTGTKHLIASACSKLKGSISPKSYNNDIGVPLTIFLADAVQDFLVLEMGTNHPGEILNLTTMAQPDIAVITNCTAEHLEGLGDLIGVRRENASIIAGMDPARGLLIINGDDSELLAAASAWKGMRITFGFNTSNDFFATDVECSADGVRFNLNGNAKVPFFIPLLGRHTACNALAAIAVGRRLGLGDADLAAGLEHATGPDMRLNLREVAGVRVLNDAYNANPASMRAALETAAGIANTGRRIAILGDMLELGRSSDRFHREIGEAAASMNFDAVICVGPQARLIADQAVTCGMDAARVTHFIDSTTAAKAIVNWLDRGDLVLLKGSRGMKLETVAAAIDAARTPIALKTAS